MQPLLRRDLYHFWKNWKEWRGLVTPAGAPWFWTHYKCCLSWRKAKLSPVNNGSFWSRKILVTQLPQRPDLRPQDSAQWTAIALQAETCSLAFLSAPPNLCSLKPNTHLYLARSSNILQRRQPLPLPVRHNPPPPPPPLQKRLQL